MARPQLTTCHCFRRAAPTSSASPGTSKPRPRPGHHHPPLCAITEFYNCAVVEELLDHSPATHVRRPRLDDESHATALDRNELGALPRCPAASWCRGLRSPRRWRPLSPPAMPGAALAVPLPEAAEESPFVRSRQDDGLRRGRRWQSRDRPVSQAQPARVTAADSRPAGLCGSASPPALSRAHCSGKARSAGAQCHLLGITARRAYRARR